MILESTKMSLRKLRDQLAIQAPRAKVRAGTPPAIVEQLTEAAQFVSRVYLLSTEATLSASLEEVQEEALAQGNLALGEWERAQQNRPKPTGIERRVHERFPTTATVKLFRDISRPARNISLGGILVSLGRDDLPDVKVGSLVDGSVSPSSDGASFPFRAEVRRRDDSGVGLRWILDSDRSRRALDGLLDAICPPRR